MKVFSISDAEIFARTGNREFHHDRSVLITPAARDVLTEAGIKVIFGSNGTSRAGAAPASVSSAPSKHASAAAGDGRAQGLLNSPEARAIKDMIIEIGHRCWLRDYNDGNGGNISARLGDHFLCTPTGVSKGFMKPEMICLVDIDGNQIAGNAPWKRTSEILSHLGIYRAVPAAMSVCHAHPIHATAFAMAGVEPPQCLIPEVEVFVGTIPVAEYKTPGSPQMSEILGKLAPKHQSILMGNHGLITWGTSVEDAYFKMEITDSYCRTLWVAAQLPSKRTTIPRDEMKILLDLKKKLGLPDEREGATTDKLCECDPWELISDRPVTCATPATKGDSLIQATNAELEKLVSSIADQVYASLKKS